MKVLHSIFQTAFFSLIIAWSMAASPCISNAYAVKTADGFQMLGYVGTNCQPIRHALLFDSSWALPSEIAGITDESGVHHTVKDCDKSHETKRTVAIVDGTLILDPIISSVGSTKYSCQGNDCPDVTQICNGNEEFCHGKTCKLSFGGYCHYLKESVTVSGQNVANTLQLATFGVSFCNIPVTPRVYLVKEEAKELIVIGKPEALIQVSIVNACYSFNHTKTVSRIPITTAMRLSHRWDVVITDPKQDHHVVLKRDPANVCTFSEQWSSEGLKNFHCHTYWSTIILVILISVGFISGLATFVTARKISRILGFKYGLVRQPSVREVREVEMRDIETTAMIKAGNQNRGSIIRASPIILSLMMFLTVSSACSDLTTSQGVCSNDRCTSSNIVSTLVQGESCFSFSTPTGLSSIIVKIGKIILKPDLELMYHHVDSDLRVSSLHNCFGSGLCTGSFCADNDKTRTLNTVTGKSLSGLGVSGCFKSCASGPWCGCLLPITSCLFWSAEFTNSVALRVLEVTSWERMLEVQIIKDGVSKSGIVREGEFLVLDNTLMVKVVRIPEESFHLPKNFIEHEGSWFWSDKVSMAGAPEINKIGSIQCETKDVSSKNCVFNSGGLTCNPHVEEVKCYSNFPKSANLMKAIPLKWDDLQLIPMVDTVVAQVGGQRSIQFELRAKGMSLSPKSETEAEVVALMAGGCYDCGSGGFLTILTKEDSGMVHFTSGILKGLVVHLDAKNTTVSHHWPVQHIEEQISWTSGGKTGIAHLSASFAFLDPKFHSGNETTIIGTEGTSGSWYDSITSWISSNWGATSFGFLIPYLVTLGIGVLLTRLILR